LEHVREQFVSIRMRAGRGVQEKARAPFEGNESAAKCSATKDTTEEESSDEQKPHRSGRAL